MASLFRAVESVIPAIVSPVPSSPIHMLGKKGDHSLIKCNPSVFPLRRMTKTIIHLEVVSLRLLYVFARG